MNQKYWKRAAKAVRTTLTYLARADEDLFYSIGSIQRYRKERGQRDEINFPGSVTGVERCLDMLVERDEAEVIRARLGKSTDNLKIYRRKFKSS